MRIAIATFWDSYDNYGQLLQCWALQQYLIKLGHQPFLIRYERVRKVTNYYDLIKQNTKCFYKKINSLYWRRRFASFRDNEIFVSKDIYDNYSSLCNNPPNADAYITGSDQVWNFEMEQDDRSVFFLNFGNKGIKRISYAPSIGHSYYKESLIKELTLRLKDFTAISVREKSAIKIVESVGYKACQVLDPTMLLQEKDYLNLCKQNNVSPIRSKKFLYIYSMNYVSVSDLPFDGIKQYTKKNDLDIIVTPGSGLHRCKKLFKDVCYDYCTPYEWLLNIKQSELVVTASFHGIVFSILLHKKFIYTPLFGDWQGNKVPKQGNERVLDLLERMGLNDFVYNSQKCIEDYIMHEIDWRSVDDKLNKYRSISYDFLNKSL